MSIQRGAVKAIWILFTEKYIRCGAVYTDIVHDLNCGFNGFLMLLLFTHLHFQMQMTLFLLSGVGNRNKLNVIIILSFLVEYGGDGEAWTHKKKCKNYL